MTWLRFLFRREVPLDRLCGRYAWTPWGMVPYWFGRYVKYQELPGDYRKARDWYNREAKKLARRK
jgi:hypothetical protein